MRVQGVDYIVVGAGSAGCVLADRLSESGKNSVLVIEAGPLDWNPIIRLPTGEVFTVGSSLDWQFESEPEASLGGTRVSLPRGRVVGGSSAINGQLYVRGHPSDYDDWANTGCDGWSFDDVLPFFKKAEAWNGPMSEWRGESGPLKTAFGRYDNQLYRAFLEAGQQLQYPFNPDFNGETQDGFGWSQFTHEHRFPLRCSSAHAYLSRARRRCNVRLLTRAKVQRLQLDGTRCVGVVCVHRGRLFKITATREVILAAGAYQSPQLLMLSGIGCSEHLGQHGIKTRVELPGVGENLQDHFGPSVQYEVRCPITYRSLKSPVGLTKAVAEYIFRKRGPLAVFPMNVQAFVRGSRLATRPDLQFYLMPMAADLRLKNPYAASYHGFGIHWCVLRPKSHGTVRLQSPDPSDAPTIRHNYFDHPDDRALNRIGFRLARQIAEQPAFEEVRGRELYPGSDVQSDDELDHYSFWSSQSHYHPVGTCRMGTDEHSVVSPTLQIHGVDQLRVVDASVMPTLVGGNTNAPTIMIAERAAAFIREAADPEDKMSFEQTQFEVETYEQTI